MKTTKYAVAAALGLAALLAPRAVLADTTVQFAASGTFADDSTLSGIFSVDVTTGVVTSADLAWSDVGSAFTTIEPETTLDGFAELVVENAAGNFIGLAFQSASLIGYSGGSLCSTADNCLGSPIIAFVESDAELMLESPSPDLLTSGSVVATPEPSSLLLLSIGLFGLMAMTWCRKRLA